jgi:hypothetical protein
VKRRGEQVREEAAARERALLCRRERVQRVRPEQVLHRVVAEEGREEARDGRQVSHTRRSIVRHAVGDETVLPGDEGEPS